MLPLLALALAPGGGSGCAGRGGSAGEPAWPESLAVWPPEALSEALADQGYLSARVARRAGAAWALDPGRPVAEVRLRFEEAGAPAASSGERRGSLGSRPPVEILLPVLSGEGLRASIEASIEALLAELGDEGRPLARVTPLSVRLEGGEREPGRLAIDLGLARGPAVSIERLRFESDGATRPGFLERVVGWRGEEPFDGRRWRSARRSLLATGLFHEVGEPLLRMPSAPEGDAGGSAMGAEAESLAAEILIRLRERRVNTVGGLLGYANRGESEGARRGRVSGYIDLRLGNLLGTGRAARLFWQALGSDQSRFELAWSEPFVWRFPLSADLELSHVQEDSLLADTRWTADLAWKPAPDWRVRLGWGASRLVLGAGVDATLARRATRFGLDRAATEPPGADAGGWAFEGRLEQWRGDGPSVMRAVLRGRGWVEWGRWRLAIEEQVAGVAGPDSLLRSDAFLLGGAASLRGSFEGEFRTWRHALQRIEFGPRLDRQGGRLYALCDVAWFAAWEATGPRPYGARAHGRVRGALGAGLQLRGGAGLMRLEYAVADGDSPLRGRLHLGMGGTF